MWWTDWIDSYLQIPVRWGNPHRREARVMAFLTTIRASRRQENNRLGDTPWRPATAATFTPDASVSAMIRIFSSSGQRRRRSTLPRTSTA